MKRRFLLIGLASLALGLVLTLAFTAQMSWKGFGDCATTQDQGLPASIRRVDCSGLSYGFPFKFVHAEPHLDISFFSETNPSPTMLGVTATAEIDKSMLVLNIMFWSALSGAVISAIIYKLSSKNPTEESTKNKNKQS